jgi:hypothetical protein
MDTETLQVAAIQSAVQRMDNCFEMAIADSEQGSQLEKMKHSTSMSIDTRMKCSNSNKKRGSLV